MLCSLSISFVASPSPFPHGGDSHIKTTGVFVGNLRRTPKGYKNSFSPLIGTNYKTKQYYFLPSLFFLPFELNTLTGTVKAPAAGLSRLNTLRSFKPLLGVYMGFPLGAFCVVQHHCISRDQRLTPGTRPLTNFNHGS